MTIDAERFNAIESARRLLSDLMDSRKTPRVPREIRKRAYWCLKHYPEPHKLDQWKREVSLDEITERDFKKPDTVDEIKAMVKKYRAIKGRCLKCGGVMERVRPGKKQCSQCG